MTILIIKLGALGDFVLADSAFKAICDYHKDEKIVLLTTPSFEKFASKLGYFDEILSLPRFSYWNLKAWYVLLKWFSELNPSRVYDLQMVGRTKRYYFAFKYLTKVSFQWIGHITSTPIFLEHSYFKMHPKMRFDRLLEKVGIHHVPPLDITRLAEERDVENLRSPYVLVIPNASDAFNGAKKWPLEKYRDLIFWLTQKGLDCVVIGGPTDDHGLLRVNSLLNHGKIHDLTGQTTLEQIIYLAKHAYFAVGNDTGPIHMAAASCCPVFVLFSRIAPPADQVGARGPLFHHLSVDNLKNLDVDTVKQELECFIKKIENSRFDELEK